MTMKKFLELEEYRISPRTGCVFENAKTELPLYFEPWEKIAKSLSKLCETKTLRDEVHKMPLLDHTRLEGHKELFLAHLELAFIAGAYVWQDGDEGVATILPRSLAVPFYEVSMLLGVMPIVSHFDTCLTNCYLLDPFGPLDLSNLRCVVDVPGGKNGQHFCLVTSLVELQFAKCVQPMVSTLKLLSKGKKNQALDKDKEDLLRAHLESLSDSIGDMKDTLAEMNDGLDPKTFFNEVRPIFSGWKGGNTPLSKGLIYEGISENPIQLWGAGGTQSTSFQALDAFLGVVHKEDEKKFFAEMRMYMPPFHAKFIEDLQQSSTQLASYVRNVASPGVQDAYNKCLTALVDFRAGHIRIVSKYILKPSRESNQQNFKNLNEAGTGGTDFIPFLSNTRSVTRKTILHPRPYSQPIPGLHFYVIAFMACLIPVAIAIYTLK